MSPVSNFSSASFYTPPGSFSPSKAKVAPTVPQQTATQAAAVSANSYRNASGDTVNFSGTVLKDRDGDGGVGLPAPKAAPAAPASNEAQMLLKAYTAH